MGSKIFCNFKPISDVECAFSAELHCLPLCIINLTQFHISFEDSEL